MDIFKDSFEYLRFQYSLYLTNSKETIKYSDLTSPCRTWTIERGETLVDIGAYCLMPNHFHLLIRSKNEKDTGLFLQRLLTSHSKYFNTKYNRTGSLFQGKSKAQHASKTDEYLKYLYSYIHLNPIKLIQPDWKEAGIKNIASAETYLCNYAYSSYIDFIGKERNESSILNRSNFPEYFETKEMFNKEITDWIIYKK